MLGRLGTLLGSTAEIIEELSMKAEMTGDMEELEDALELLRLQLRSEVSRWNSAEKG